VTVEAEENNRETVVGDELFDRIRFNKLDLNNIDISVLNLTPGLETKLRSINVTRLEELVNFPLDDFFQIHMAGPTGLIQIRNKLDSFVSILIALAGAPTVNIPNTNDGCTMTSVDGVTPADKRLPAIEHDDAFLLDQLIKRAQDLLHKIDEKNVFYYKDYILPTYVRNALFTSTTFSINTIADFKEYLHAENIRTHLYEREKLNYPRLYRMYKTIDEIGKIIIDGNIDQEIKRITATLSDREYQIFVNRFTVDKHVTLQQLGDRYNLCRERIRQVEKEVKAKIKRRLYTCSYTLLAASLKLYQRNADTVSRKSWETILMASGFLQNTSSIDLLMAVSNMDVHPDLSLSKRALASFKSNIPLNALSIAGSIIQKACKCINNSGAVRIGSLTENNISRQSIESIFAASGITLVDSEWATKVDSIDVLKRTAYKMLYYCGPLSRQQLKYGLAKHMFRLGYHAPPSDVILKVLELTGEFYQKDDLLFNDFTVLEEPDCNDRELLFIELIDQEGPVVTYNRFFDKLKDAGYSGASVASVLKYSPLIQKIGFSLYTILGRRYDDVDIEKAQSSIRQVRPLPTLKPRVNGQVIFEANVGNWIKYSGVIYSGPAKVMKGTWKMYMNGQYQNDLVVDNLFIRGLTRAYEVLQIEPGDRIKLCFDTIKLGVTVSRVWNYE